MNFRLTAILFGVVFVLGVVLLILSFSSGKKAPGDLLCAELALAGVKAEDIDTVELERPGAGTLLLVRTDKEKNTWQIQKPITAPADAGKVTPVVGALLRAKPTPYSDIRTNPALHGLDPASLKVTLKAGDRSSTVNLGDVTFGDKGVVFVTTSSQQLPMAVKRGDLDPLFREAKDGKAGDLAKWTGDYRSSNVFPADSRAVGEDVAALRLELPNKKPAQVLALGRGSDRTWRFEGDKANWGAADAEGDPAATGFTGVRRLLGALTSLSAADPADFIDSPKDLKEYGLNADNPDLIKVEMKPREGPPMTVFLGKREGGPEPKKDGTEPAPPQTPAKVYARIEGLPGVIRASGSDLGGLAAVIADPSPLRDRTLLNAARDRIDGLNIALPKQPDTRLRRAGSSEWKLYGGPNDPQNAHQPAVVRLLDAITARRTIGEFVADGTDFVVDATVDVWADAFSPAGDGKGEPSARAGAAPTKLEFGRKDDRTLYARRTLPGLKPSTFVVPAKVKAGTGTEETDVLAALRLGRLDLLDRNLPSFSEPAKLTVRGPSNYAVARADNPDPLTKEPMWQFDAADPRKGQTADGQTVREEVVYPLATLGSALTRFVAEAPTDKELEAFGLKQPRLVAVVDLPPGADPKQITYEFGGHDPNDNDKVYARVAGRAAVFTVDASRYTRLANPDLRDRQVFRGVSPASITKLKVTGWGGLTLTFHKKGSEWALDNPPGDFVADSKKVNDFVNGLLRVRAEAFEGKAAPKHGFDRKRENLRVVLDRSDGKPVTVDIGSPAEGKDKGYFVKTSTLPDAEPVFTTEVDKTKKESSSFDLSKYKASHIEFLKE